MSERLLLSERVRRRLSEIAEMLEEIEEIETETARLRAEVERLRLTVAEREAVATASRIAGAVGESDVKAALRALLARLGGGQ